MSLILIDFLIILLKIGYCVSNFLLMLFIPMVIFTQIQGFYEKSKDKLSRSPIPGFLVFLYIFIFLLIIWTPNTQIQVLVTAYLLIGYIVIYFQHRKEESSTLMLHWYSMAWMSVGISYMYLVYFMLKSSSYVYDFLFAS
jgi:hypothetical protein